MFFGISKILEAFTEPFDFAMAIGLVGLALGLAGFRRWGGGLCAAAIVLLALGSYTPAGCLPL